MRKGKRLLAFSLAMVMAVSSFAGNGYVAKAAGINTDEVTALGKSKKAVTSVSITNVNTQILVLKKKGTYKLKVKVKATGGASKKVTFTSSKPKIVSVSSKGKLSAKKNGTAKITVKSKFNKKKKAVLTVKVGTPVKKVKLKESKIALKVGETAILATTVSPKKPTRKTLSYTSSNKKIATVDKKGVVTAVAPGTAKITVKATDGSGKKDVATVTVTEVAATTEQQTTTEQPEEKYNSPYTEADVVWTDEFNGTSLNTADWNYEKHEPGWVNSELQEYVESDQNVYVKDGNLVIKAIKTANGYTSGRVNTQGKHDYKYGKFEARVKVPKGMGFLPAFWMMPTEENLYGQWPKCGEIDIMEVMGQTNDLVYGTIHYGEPHRESQGTYTLPKGNFTDDYHVFSCEWEPGKIKWIVDGVLYHEEDDWYSTKKGQGTVTYPAPFDQPFYMILNLAVGGSWVGNPDATTSFDNAELVVDYVKVYQKDESYYDENVKKPVKEVVLRAPDANGNYVNNGNFAVAESLADDKDWEFKTALGGEAKAEIANGAMNITTTKEGEKDYSVQLVQAGIPFEKGATYKVSFDASASAARTMNVAVKAPDYGYAEYMPATSVELTTVNNTYSYEFKMTSDSDANGRLEFNMGAAGSTAGIVIKNVKVEKIKAANPNEKEVKTVLSDGNHVYNGSFQEGEGRLGYWEITNNAKADISVTNLKDRRRLKVTVAQTGTKAEDVTVAQSDLALLGNMEYELSFKAQADAAKTMKVMVAGEEYEAELTTDAKTYSFKFKTPETLTNKNIAFYMGAQGTIYLDDVRLVEDTLIKNGSFNAGFTGYEVYIHDTASATYIVDSQTEQNAADFTITKTGKEPYMVQLKQGNVRLEKDKWYTLKFDIRSSIDRSIQYSIQRDGLAHKKDGKEDWQAYVQDTVKLTASNKEYTPVEVTFQMKFDTDEGSIFNIAMGGSEDTSITTSHRICIDNISLEEKVKAPEVPEVPAGDNLVQNGNFANDGKPWELNIHEDGGKGATGSAEVVDGKAVFNITNVGTDEWHVQLKQSGITLEKGSKYKVKFTIQSTEARWVKFALQNQKDVWYCGADIELQAKTPLVFENEEPYEITEDTDENISFVISMGQIFNWSTEGKGDKKLSVPSTIEISDVSLVKVSSGEVQEPDDPGKEEPDTPEEPKENLLNNADFANDGEGWNPVGDWSFKERKAEVNITELSAEGNAWDVQLTRKDVKLVNGKSYIVSFKATSTLNRKIAVVVQNSNYDPWYGGDGSIELKAEEEQPVTIPFTMTKASDDNAVFQINLGTIEKEALSSHTIIISDVSIVEQKDEEEQIDPKPLDENLLLNTGFAGNNKDPWWCNGAEEDIQDNAITLTINDVGEAASDVLFGQSNIQLEKGCTYQITFKVKSDTARDIICKMCGAAAPWTTYGKKQISLTADSESFQDVNFTFKMEEPTDKIATFEIELGKINDEDENLGQHKITISGLSLKKIDEAE